MITLLSPSLCTVVQAVDYQCLIECVGPQVRRLQEENQKLLDDLTALDDAARVRAGCIRRGAPRPHSSDLGVSARWTR